MKRAIKCKIIHIKHTQVFIHIFENATDRPFKVLFCEQLAHKSEFFALILLNRCKRVHCNRPFYSCMPSDLAFEWKRGWR